MYQKLLTTAKELGFARCYALPLEPLSRWGEAVMGEGQFAHARDLVSDPRQAYPSAKCILLLVYAYQPFQMGEKIPAYYLASQRSYLAAVEFTKCLQEEGFLAERIHVPARALALQNGIGFAGKNGLLYLDEFGSRIVLQTVVTDACEPQPVVRGDEDRSCDSCGACAAACPARAIDGENGLTPAKCLRAHMEKAPFPKWVEERMPGYLGCEICQSVCPKNAHLAVAEPSDEVREAFLMERLIAGDASAARRLTGKNLSGGGKLTYQANCFKNQKCCAENGDPSPNL
ncbi:MAG: 4Fe-4S dicluster domain-containing protein [Clostridia bacterium]|nr:4Fe-4S dicluster domain-containing protein [Clostridia bacterium]